MLNNYKGNSALLKQRKQERLERIEQRLEDAMVFLGLAASAGAIITILNWSLLGVFQ